MLKRYEQVNLNDMSDEISSCLDTWCWEFRFDRIRFSIVDSQEATLKCVERYLDKNSRHYVFPYQFAKSNTNLLSQEYVLIVEFFKRAEPFSSAQKKQAESISNVLNHWANYWLSFHEKKLAYKRNDPLSKHLLLKLSDAEINVLLLLVEGKDGSDIARIRQVSKETVRSQIKALLNKTGCKSQNQLIASYYTNKLGL